jgi:hypothetical protein
MAVVVMSRGGCWREQGWDVGGAVKRESLRSQSIQTLTSELASIRPSTLAAQGLCNPTSPVQTNRQVLLLLSEHGEKVDHFYRIMAGLLKHSRRTWDVC